MPQVALRKPTLPWPRLEQLERHHDDEHVGEPLEQEQQHHRQRGEAQRGMVGQRPQAPRHLAEGAGHLVLLGHVLGPAVLPHPEDEEDDDGHRDRGDAEDEARRGRAEQDAGGQRREQGAGVFHRAMGDVAGRELLRRLHQGRGQRGVRRTVAAEGNREERREGEDDRRRCAERGGDGGPAEDDRAGDAAAEQHGPSRKAVDRQPDQRRGERAREEPDQGDEADPDRPVRLEAVDAEGDREAPHGKGAAEGRDTEQTHVAVGEIEHQGADARPQHPPTPLHHRPQDSRSPQGRSGHRFYPFPASAFPRRLRRAGAGPCSSPSGLRCRASGRGSPRFTRTRFFLVDGASRDLLRPPLRAPGFLLALLDVLVLACPFGAFLHSARGHCRSFRRLAVPLPPEGRAKHRIRRFGRLRRG